MACDFEYVDTNQLFEADTNYGPIGVSPNDMPNEVSKLTGMERCIVTGLSLDLSAMKDVVAQTCTAAFHRKKGHIDCFENSTFTLQQVEDYFDIPEDYDPHNMNHTFRNKFTSEINEEVLNHGNDAIFELDDFMVLITHDECNESFQINLTNWVNPSPSHNPFVCYIMNEEQSDKWAQENRYMEHASKTMERIGEKPIQIFHATDKFKRGNHTFEARDIYQELNEKAYDHPVFLKFKGVYVIDRICGNYAILKLNNTNNRFIKQ